jgi:hypothetical protein
MTSEARPDEYEALEPCPNPWCNSTTAPVLVALKREGWRVACACGVSTHRASSEAEAIATWSRRDHVEAKLAEVRAERDDYHKAALRHREQVQLQIEALADRDRTIAEQAAELAKLRRLADRVRSLHTEAMDLERISPAQAMEELGEMLTAGGSNAN